MVSIVSIAEVRAKIGIQDDIISDSTIQELIDLTESNTRDILKINITPKINIDVIKPDNNRQQQLRRKFPLKIISVKVGTREVDPKTIYLNYIAGLISFKSNSSEAIFATSVTERVKVKYLNAFISKNEDVIKEIDTADVTSGSDVSVNVGDAADMIVDDYFMFEDLEGSVEVAKVTDISGAPVIVFDSLINDYVIGSLLTKIKPNEVLKQYILYESAVASAVNAIGGSYNFNTSYSIEGVTTNLGVPHPHFSKTVDELKKLRDKQWELLQSRVVSIA